MDRVLRERLERVEARLRWMRARTGRAGPPSVPPQPGRKAPTVNLAEIAEIEGLAPPRRRPS